MAYDYSKLHGRIVEKYRTFTAFSKEIDVPVSVISTKINGKKPITRKDIETWMIPLEIDRDEIGVYFFTPKV